MSGEYCVDANVFIEAWYEGYPPRIFKSLWPQLAEHKDDIVLIKPIFDEIEPVSSADNKLAPENKKEKYPLRAWLEEQEFKEIKIDDETNGLSIQLEKEYEISNESKGAGQNDITLMAYAKITSKTVVTLENDQPQKPGKKSNYKIPLICRENNIKCVNFIGMLDALGIKV